MTTTSTRSPASRRMILALAISLSGTASASNAHIPQPWRSDAVVLGRDEAYDTERFLHELTFDHRQALPTAMDNGIRGTGGSVSSRRPIFCSGITKDPLPWRVRQYSSTSPPIPGSSASARSWLSATKPSAEPSATASKPETG
ncbi:MAG: hypothetical protein LPK15_10700 [Alteromonadaceae bacterium]|nr:hypothetical protein [Alteromonadaceae bacterium]